MILFFDTETTGLPLWSEPSEHPGQPHIVSASGMIERPGDDVTIFDMVVKPDGWEIPDDAAKIHGITTDMALEKGEDALTVLVSVFQMIMLADLVVGHGIDFDMRLMRIAAHRHKLGDPEQLKEKKTFCTMRASTPLCQLPATVRMMRAGRNTYKTPKLSEAYKFFFDEELQGAHNSLNDVRACQRIYKELQLRGSA